MKDRMGSVMVLPDLDVRLDEMRARRTRRDHTIVVADVAFFLNAENLAKIDARDCNKSDALLFGVDGEPRIVSRDVNIPNEGVGGLDRGDPGQHQLLGQTVLQSVEDAFRAPSRLRRIGRDMFDAQMVERPAHLGQARPIDLSASGCPDPCRGSTAGRGRAFLLDQKSRKYRARRIVQRHDQIERRLAEKPLML
jgi:hypothetical protein